MTSSPEHESSLAYNVDKRQLDPSIPYPLTRSQIVTPAPSTVSRDRRYYLISFPSASSPGRVPLCQVACRRPIAAINKSRRDGGQCSTAPNTNGSCLALSLTTSLFLFLLITHIHSSTNFFVPQQSCLISLIRAHYVISPPTFRPSLINRNHEHWSH